MIGTQRLDLRNWRVNGMLANRLPRIPWMLQHNMVSVQRCSQWLDDSGLITSICTDRCWEGRVLQTIWCPKSNQSEVISLLIYLRKVSLPKLCPCGHVQNQDSRQSTLQTTSEYPNIWLPMVLENLPVGQLNLSRKYTHRIRDVRTKTKQQSAILDFWWNTGGPTCTRRKYQKGYGTFVWYMKVNCYREWILAENTGQAMRGSPGTHRYKRMARFWKVWSSLLDG